MEKNYFDDANLSELKNFIEKWGSEWGCYQYVENQPDEDVKRCKEAVIEINTSVVAPRYEDEWKKYMPHESLLQKLAECMKKYQRLEMPPRCTIEGRSGSNTTKIATGVRALLNLAIQHGEFFHSIIQKAVKDTNGEYQRGPQKKSYRIGEKAKLEYKGDVSRVIDVERGTGIYDSSDDLAEAIAKLSNLSNRYPCFTIARVKDSFSTIAHKNTRYRDAKFSIRIEGLVGELRLALRKIERWHKMVHHVYNIERIVINGEEGKAAPHCGLGSVPALRFTRDEGVSIVDGDCLDDLQNKIETVLPKGCTLSGVYLSNNAVNVYLGVTNIASFAKLRDAIIVPNNKFDVALAPFRVDIGAFIDLYATNMMKFVELTSHQEDQLQKICGADIALLLAPAGGGKTFVAVHCMIEAIQDGDHVLFAARNLPLALFVVRWLVLASGKSAEKVVEKVRVLINDNGWKFANGPLRVTVVDNDGRQALTVEKPIKDVSSYRMVIVDEAHHVVGDATLQEQLKKIQLKRYLVLGDISQSNMRKELTEDSIREFLDLPDSQPIVVAKLTEVVRSTKRIVAGSSSFQLTTASKAETKTHMSSEGLPLVPQLFAPVSVNDRTKAYAFNIVQALKKVKKSLNNVNLDDRVMIICPDDSFVEELRLPLQEELRSQMKEEQYNLVSALDASAALPRQPSTNATEFPRWLVFDTIDQFDGLERLVVIATGLDRSIQETEGDIQTRSAMYRALTRAQLAAAVVNEYVKDGFLEFLRKVKFDESGSYNEKKLKRQMSFAIADEVQAKAVTKTVSEAIASPTDSKSSKKQKQRRFKNAIGKISSRMLRSSRSKQNQQPVKNNIDVVRNIQTSQTIWDTRATVNNIINEDTPRFMPFTPKIEMNERGFQLSTSTGKTLIDELNKKRVTDINLPRSDIGAKRATMLAEALKVNTSLASINLKQNRIGDEGTIALAEALKVNTSLTSINLQQNKIGVDGAKAFGEMLKNNTSLTSINLQQNKIGAKGATLLAESLKSLTSINLKNNGIGDEGATALAIALKVNTSLTSMNLKYNGIGDEGATALAEALKANTSLTIINLQHNKIGDEGAMSLAEALTVNTSLTSINLQQNKIGAEGAAALAEALKVNPSLTSMHLKYNEIGAEGATVLAEALMANTSLTSINLQEYKIGADGAMALAEVLKVNPSLISINLYWNEIYAEGAMALAEALRINTSLTAFNLNRNQIGDVGLRELAEALKVNISLTTLSLEDNKIGDEGMKSLAEALKVNKSLSTINSEHNEIGDDGAAALAEALKVNTSLTTLNLKDNKINDEGATSLAEALKVNTLLTNLSLEDNKIGDESASALAEALKLNASLTSMDLGGNEIGDEGATVLAEALKANSSLVSINLQQNKIRAKGATALAEALKANASLTIINLHCNKIGNEGATALAEALKVNTSLTGINLYWNKIGDEGAIALAETLKMNTSLTNINVHRNNIGDNGARSLAEALKVNTSLTSISLEDNKFGAEGAMALAEALEVNTSIH